MSDQGQNCQTVLVDDGQYVWVAGKAELVAALEGLGWVAENFGLGWALYAVPESDDPAAAYTALCQVVQPLRGEGMDQDVTDADWYGLVLRFLPHHGSRCWVANWR